MKDSSKTHPSVQLLDQPNLAPNSGNTHDADRSHIKGPAKSVEPTPAHKKVKPGKS